MSDRNWEAELAKIDKQLASISDDQLVAEKRAAAAKPAAALPGAKGAAAPGALPGAPASIGVVPAKGRWMGWVQVLLATAAAAGLWFWPWPASCGGPLYGFVAATGAVTLLGLWSAIGSWRHRLGLAHILSLAVVGWGVVLGAREVLPRVGYAIPTEQRGATWSCVAPAPAAPATTPPNAAAEEPPPTATPSTTPPAASPVTPPPAAPPT